MNVEQRADALRDGGVKRHQSHGEFLDVRDIHFGEVAHQDAGEGDAHDQKEGEVIRGQGDVFDLGDKEAPQEEIGYGSQQNQAGKVDARQSELDQIIGDFHPEEAVHIFEQLQTPGYRFQEKSEVAQYGDQEGVMKRQGAHPEKDLQAVAESPLVGQLHAGVAEKGTKGQDFQSHPDKDAELGRGVVDPGRLDPVQ